MKTKEEKKAYAKKWSLDNKDKKKLYAERYRNKHLNKYLLKSCKRNALARNHIFDITHEDIVIPDVCPVFKVPFKRNTMLAASVDRIDSNKGYTKDNIQIISRLANLMKSNSTKEQRVLFAKWVLANE